METCLPVVPDLVVTEAHARLNKGNGPTRAFVDIVLNAAFKVCDLRVIDGENGLFVAMPSRRVDDGYRDTAFPITAEARTLITVAALEALQEAAEQA